MMTISKPLPANPSINNQIVLEYEEEHQDANELKKKLYKKTL